MINTDEKFIFTIHQSCDGMYDIILKSGNDTIIFQKIMSRNMRVKVEPISSFGNHEIKNVIRDWYLRLNAKKTNNYTRVEVLYMYHVKQTT